MIDVLMEALSLYKQNHSVPALQKTEPTASLAKATVGSIPHGG